MPFYIGVGTCNEHKKTFKGVFARAFATSSRSIYWKRVVKKSNYEIEIVLTSHDKNFILEKEIEFISMYKRSDDGGTLVNHSSGGDPGNGVIPTEEELQRRSNFFTEYWKNNVNPRSRTLYQYNLLGELIGIFQSLRQAAKELSLNSKTLAFYVKNNSKSSLVKLNFLFSYQKFEIEEALEEIDSRMKRNKYENRIFPVRKIKQLDKNGNYIKTWTSIKEVINFFHCKKQSIHSCISQKSKTSMGFKWEYEDI